MSGFFYKSEQLLHIAHEEGRALKLGDYFRYEFNLTDHLGNVRVSFSDTDYDGALEAAEGEVFQVDQYYPFGMRMGGLSYQAGTENRYRYNGKEFHQELGLGLYDYGARMYDPAIARWNGVDVQSEKYLSFSPFSYVANNPVKFIDPNGEEIWIDTGNGLRVQYRNGELYDEDGNIYTAEEGSFAANTLIALNHIVEAGGAAGEALVGVLAAEKGSEGWIGDTEIFQETEGKPDEAIVSPEKKISTIFWDPTTGLINTDGQIASPALKLAHEFGHSYFGLTEHPSHIKENIKSDVIYSNSMEKFVTERTESVISQAFERNGFGAFDRDNHCCSEFIEVIGGPQSSIPKNGKLADILIGKAKIELRHARKKAIEVQKKGSKNGN